MFGEIRSAAQRAPGEAAWEAICEAVEAIEPARLREEVVPYLNAHLRHWPDAARCVPARWLRAIARDEPAPIEALAITRRLVLRAAGVRDMVLFGLLERFEQLSQLGALRILDLSSCGLQGVDLFVLGNAPIWRHVTTLDLSHNALDTQAVEDLLFANVDLTDRAPLHTLSLAWNFICDGGVEALLDEGLHLHKTLTTLDLRNNRLGTSWPACSRWLHQAVSMSQLHTLRLGWNALGDAGVRALLAAPWQASLTALDLSENGITDAGAEALLDDPRVGQLHTLDLFGNELGIASARVIAASAHLSGLRELELSANPIGHAGRRLIMRAAHLPLRLRRQAEDWERLEPDDDDEPLDV